MQNYATMLLRRRMVMWRLWNKLFGWEYVRVPRSPWGFIWRMYEETVYLSTVRRVQCNTQGVMYVECPVTLEVYPLDKIEHEYVTSKRARQ